MATTTATTATKVIKSPAYTTINFPDSACLSSAFYDAKEKLLAVLFKSGHSYNYFGVGRSIFDALCKAKSVGSFYHQHIKDIYESEKVEG